MPKKPSSEDELTNEKALTLIESRVNHLIKVNHDTSIIAPEKETLLLQIFQFNKRWEEFVNLIRSRLKDELTELGFTSAKGLAVSATISESGSRYILGSDTEVIDPKFYKVTLTPNAEEIEKFLKKQGHLPNGIEVNANRPTGVRVTLRNRNQL